jgi:hypothetical protein
MRPGPDDIAYGGEAMRISDLRLISWDNASFL